MMKVTVMRALQWFILSDTHVLYVCFSVTDTLHLLRTHDAFQQEQQNKERKNKGRRTKGGRTRLHRPMPTSCAGCVFGLTCTFA